MIYNCSCFCPQMESSGIKIYLGVSTILEDQTCQGPLCLRTEGECEEVYGEQGSGPTWWICLFPFDVAYFIPLITSHMSSTPVTLSSKWTMKCFLTDFHAFSLVSLQCIFHSSTLNMFQIKSKVISRVCKALVTSPSWRSFATLVLSLLTI